MYNFYLLISLEQQIYSEEIKITLFILLGVYVCDLI